MEKSRSQKKRVSIAGMHIDRASAVPIYLQIAAHLRNGILQGALLAGTQFLGSREIARELGCSRTVILTAWDLLYAEGYLESTPRGGVTVASVKQAQVNPAPAMFAHHNDAAQTRELCQQGIDAENTKARVAQALHDLDTAHTLVPTKITLAKQDDENGVREPGLSAQR